MGQNIHLFVAVKAFILNEKGEVLLLREAASYKDGTNIGKYDVPGGRIDSNESLSDALYREVMEETGLAVQQSELLDVHDTFNEKGNETWHIVRLFYKVLCGGEEVILSKDHAEYVWTSAEEAIKRDDIIKNLVPLLKSWREKRPRMARPDLPHLSQRHSGKVTLIPGSVPILATSLSY